MVVRMVPGTFSTPFPIGYINHLYVVKSVNVTVEVKMGLANQT